MDRCGEKIAADNHKRLAALFEYLRSFTVALEPFAVLVNWIQCPIKVPHI